MTYAQIKTRVLTRIGADQADAAAQADAGAAVNLGQRLLALLTLCLESTRELPLTPGAWRYRMLREWPDWIAPLRVRLSTDQSAGADSIFDGVQADAGMFNEETYASRPAPARPKLRPARLADLAALNPAWIATPGTPERYATAGFDHLFLDKQPATSGTVLLVTYARSPLPLTGDGQTPEIPAADHLALADFATAWLRLPEGGQELGKAAVYLGRFVDAARQRAAAVRARSIAARYDKLPLELERFDVSRLVRTLARKETSWPPTSTSRR